MQIKLYLYINHRINYPYAAAMSVVGFGSLRTKKAAACEKFIKKACQCPPVIPSPVYQD